MTPSKILLLFCFSFVLGVFISSFFLISWFLLLFFLIFEGFLALFSLKNKKILFLVFCFPFLFLGIWRYLSKENQISESKLYFLNREEAEVFLTAIVVKEPISQNNNQKIILGSLSLLSETGFEEKIEGKILATSRLYPKYKYGDKLKIKGKIKSPPFFEDFNYKDFLKKDGIYSIAEWPEIELLDSGQGNFLMKNLFWVKDKLKESIIKILSPPQSGLLAGLFFGDDGDISKEWKEKFSLTGTSHIVAVSGMNITIISVLLLNFLLFLGFWRSQAFYFSLFLILFYVLMIGAPASAIRAAIMAILFLLAQYLGRLANAFPLLVFSAVLMLFQNPLLLKLDIGFQLSFLAMAGLIFIQPLFSVLLKKIPDIFQLRYSLSATLSAQIFTLPILIYNFGRISIVAPLTNILIVPLLPAENNSDQSQFLIPPSV